VVTFVEQLLGLTAPVSRRTDHRAPYLRYLIAVSTNPVTRKL
jgi:hypothetical protein